MYTMLSIPNQAPNQAGGGDIEMANVGGNIEMANAGSNHCTIPAGDYQFSFPVWQDSVLTVENRSLHQSKIILVKWCKAYKIPYSCKNIPELQSQQTWTRWMGKTQPLKRNHRGPRPTRTTKFSKLSYQRHHEQFGPRPTQADNRNVVTSLARVHDHCSEAEKEELLLWADEICASVPYRPPTSPPSIPTPVMPTLSETHEHYDQQLSQLSSTVSGLSQAIATLASSMASTSAAASVTTGSPAASVEEY
ncbi:hypothetical protein H0H92_002704, partial [Tricholoma furcatifolium]